MLLIATLAAIASAFGATAKPPPPQVGGAPGFRWGDCSSAKDPTGNCTCGDMQAVVTTGFGTWEQGLAAQCVPKNRLCPAGSRPNPELGHYGIKASATSACQPLAPATMHCPKGQGSVRKLNWDLPLWQCFPMDMICPHGTMPRGGGDPFDRLEVKSSPGQACVPIPPSRKGGVQTQGGG